MADCRRDDLRRHADSRLPDEDLSVAVEIFRLLADPTRVDLLHALADQPPEDPAASGPDEAPGPFGELGVTAPAEQTGRRAAAVSRHLGRLRMGRLVITRRQGTAVHNRLADDHVARLVLDALRRAEHLGSGVSALHR